MKREGKGQELDESVWDPTTHLPSPSLAENFEKEEILNESVGGNETTRPVSAAWSSGSSRAFYGLNGGGGGNRRSWPIAPVVESGNYNGCRPISEVRSMYSGDSHLPQPVGQGYGGGSMGHGESEGSHTYHTHATTGSSRDDYAMKTSLPVGARYEEEEEGSELPYASNEKVTQFDDDSDEEVDRGGLGQLRVINASDEDRHV